MKDVAITGLPFSGKSTVFNAVARAHASTGGGAQKANVAVVSVPEPRLDRLARMHSSEKTVYSQVRLTDIPGLSANALGDARAADALAVVLRDFGDDADPARDLATFRAELAVADLQTVEKVLERSRKQSNKDEIDLYERAEAVLSDDRWLREQDWAPEERRALGLLTPLTLKPVLYVVNVDEAHEGDHPLGGPLGRPGAGEAPVVRDEPVMTIRGLLEAEAADLDTDEADALLREFGVEESATSRFVHTVYSLLHLVTFFTVGPKESRAWEVADGATAPQAAGVVHTDFERAFIRAEIESYDDLVAAGSWEAAREKGLMRVEGRDYVVREGDVLHIRHSA